MNYATGAHCPTCLDNAHHYPAAIYSPLVGDQCRFCGYVATEADAYDVVHESLARHYRREEERRERIKARWDDRRARRYRQVRVSAELAPVMALLGMEVVR